MKLPGTWATVNNVRRYTRMPEPPAPGRLSGSERPPKRLIMASTQGRPNTSVAVPPVTLCPWCLKPGSLKGCSTACRDARKAFVSHCSSYGLDGVRLLREHGITVARQQAADFDRPVPTRYALSLLRDREETGSDGVRMAASFHAGRLAELISKNKIDLARVAGFDCDVTPD